MRDVCHLIDLDGHEDVIAIGEKQSGTYWLSGNNIKATNFAHVSSVIKESDVEVWHQRLAHASKAFIRRMLSQGILKTDPIVQKSTCVQCAEGKQTRAPATGNLLNATVLVKLYIQM